MRSDRSGLLRCKVINNMLRSIPELLFISNAKVVNHFVPFQLCSLPNNFYTFSYIWDISICCENQHTEIWNDPHILTPFNTLFFVSVKGILCRNWQILFVFSSHLKWKSKSTPDSLSFLNELCLHGVLPRYIWGFSAIFIASSWMRAAYVLESGHYLFIKSQPHLPLCTGTS